MQDVSKGEGRTVLFVSHNMTAVKNLCHNGIVLNNGRIVFNGKINDVIDFYLNGQSERSKIKISEIQERQGNRSLLFKDIRFYGSDGHERESFRVGDSVTIELSIDIDKRYETCNKSRVDIGINNNMGERSVWLSTYVFSDKIKLDNGILRFNIPHLNLQQGTYNVNLFSTVDDCVADWIQNVAKLQVEPFDYYNTGRDIPANQGYFIMDFSII
jgi:lipopolysaccharide transport system ATP-binding protein